jgi:3'(2'), 5'-bisphosphate nucleotidase
MASDMLEQIEKIALTAGKAILDVYQAGANVTFKDDASPVTEADERAEAIILEGLEKAFPGIPVVAEESVAAGRIPDIEGKSFFLVDPLDGTKEFINRRDDFTVNIAYVENGVPVLGVVYAPARNVAFSGGKAGASKFSVSPDFAVVDRQSISCKAPSQTLTAVASRSHNSPETEAFLREKGISETRSVGSSLKFCILAEGLADVYPRFGRTMEWDTAAGDAVLRAAGGMTYDLDRQPFRYGKTGQVHDSDFANGHFVSWACPD